MPNTLFFRDLRETKQQLITAIEEFKKLDSGREAPPKGALEEVLSEVDVFIDEVGYVKDGEVRRGFSRLLMSRNHDRAIALVQKGALDYELRLWIRIPLRIIAWPFILLVRLIKLGLP